MQQSGPQLLLHPGNLFGHRGLPDAQLGGGSAEGAEINHAREEAKRLNPIHAVLEDISMPCAIPAGNKHHSFLLTSNRSWILGRYNQWVSMA